MKQTLIVLMLSVAFATGCPTLFAQEQGDVNTCVDCHLQLEEPFAEPAQKFKNDYHQKRGLSCASCHGGDPTAADAETSMSPDRGFVGTPSAREIPQSCGRCHSDPDYMRRYNPSLATDQLDKYETSHHGELLKQGDSKVAHCVSCHSVHDIRPVNDPLSTVYPLNVPQTCARCHAHKDYMASYKIPTDQFVDYKSGVHGIALLEKQDTGSPACNDCHGNHGAVPPGVPSIGHVCHQCHLVPGELFSKSPHKPAFDALGEAECVFCHSDHAIKHPTDDLVGVEEGSICVECHSEGEAGYEAAIVMRVAIDSLREKYERSKELLEDAERKGVEVSDALFNLRHVHDALVRTRTLIHAFDPARVKASADEAMVTANEVNEEARQSIAEVGHRRSGLAIFTVIIIFVVITLYAKIRDMERRKTNDRFGAA